jgi:hypothetical protein
MFVTLDASRRDPQPVGRQRRIVECIALRLPAPKPVGARRHRLDGAVGQAAFFPDLFW